MAQFDSSCCLYLQHSHLHFLMILSYLQNIRAWIYTEGREPQDIPSSLHLSHHKLVRIIISIAILNVTGFEKTEYFMQEETNCIFCSMQFDRAALRIHLVLFILPSVQGGTGTSFQKQGAMVVVIINPHALLGMAPSCLVHVVIALYAQM